MTEPDPASAIFVRALGDAAATIVFGPRADAATQSLVQGFCGLLAARKPPGVQEWAPAFASVTIWFDPDLLAFDALRDILLALAHEGARTTLEGARYEIPFCADAEFAPDLAETAALKGLSPQAYVAALAATEFRVAMLGFLPGFAYLSGLPDALDAPRLATPRKKVPARSLAVADGMCAAYPLQSPGGWRLIGRTPAPLFDPRRPENPALFAPGDRVRWRAIDRGRFDELEAQWARAFDPSQLRAPA